MAICLLRSVKMNITYFITLVFITCIVHTNPFIDGVIIEMGFSFSTDITRRKFWYDTYLRVKSNVRKLELKEDFKVIFLFASFNEEGIVKVNLLVNSYVFEFDGS